MPAPNRSSHDAGSVCFISPRGSACRCAAGAYRPVPERSAARQDRARERLDGLDVHINVAGAFVRETIEAGSLSTWQRKFDINLTTALCCCKAALQHMADGGRIVNIGATSAELATIGMAPYAVPNSAVAHLTESLAEYLRPRSVCVNAKLPQVIGTPASRRDMPDEDWAKWPSPTAVVEFLVSDNARAISGALIPVTYGIT